MSDLGQLMTSMGNAPATRPDGRMKQPQPKPKKPVGDGAGAPPPPAPTPGGPAKRGFPPKRPGPC